MTVFLHRVEFRLGLHHSKATVKRMQRGRDRYLMTCRLQPNTLNNATLYQNDVIIHQTAVLILDSSTKEMT